MFPPRPHACAWTLTSACPRKKALRPAIPRVPRYRNSSWQGAWDFLMFEPKQTVDIRIQIQFRALLSIPHS
jgi:hypothetical protein